MLMSSEQTGVDEAVVAKINDGIQKINEIAPKVIELSKHPLAPVGLGVAGVLLLGSAIYFKGRNSQNTSGSHI